MEEKFIVAWEESREQAQKLGVRLRPVNDPMKTAHQSLSGNRESDGFFSLAEKGRLDLSLEALSVDKRFTALFSDEEADRALERLLSAEYYK